MPVRFAIRALARTLRVARPRAGAIVLALAFAGPSHAQGSAGFGRFSSVRVDVRPMLAQGAGVEAEALRADLTAALRESFADRVGGRGPGLVVVVNSLSMNPYVGNSSRFGRGGMQNDYLDGEALLVGANGQVLARHPQLSVLPASSGGAWYDPASERRRVAAIAAQYAAWLARSLPLD